MPLVILCQKRQTQLFHFNGLLVLLFSLLMSMSAQAQVSTQYGMLTGAVENNSHIKSFKGVPFAQPPVGNLRWQAPQPLQTWTGNKDATQFANQCMQLPLYSDMAFRSAQVSEDCLYLNIWTANTQAVKAKPVLLYFYGGGFAAGDSSEYRYDGASMAHQDIVVVTANYRLGIFGLLAHPELSAQSQYNGSGNYTFMDQAAALQWVVDNISAFGGDPERITIAGESAGSLSVSALMASDLSKHLIAGAIGESGSLLGPTLSTIALKDAEANGSNMAKALAELEGKNEALSLAQLRKMQPQTLLELSTKAGFQWFMPTIDGHVFTKTPYEIFKAGEHAKVPLLAGNNSQEGSYKSIFNNLDVNKTHFEATIKSLYPNDYQTVLALYNGDTPEELKDAAQDLASDRFISFSTWNWANETAKAMPEHVYYYQFSKVRPASVDMPLGHKPGNRGAVHSAEIEYALGNLNRHPAYQWTNEDHVVSNIMQAYFVNFIKTGQPNSAELPKWPLFSEHKQMNINTVSIAQNIHHLRQRYDFHKRYYGFD